MACVNTSFSSFVVSFEDDGLVCINIEDVADRAEREIPVAIKRAS